MKIEHLLLIKGITSIEVERLIGLERWGGKTYIFVHSDNNNNFVQNSLKPIYVGSKSTLD